MKKNFLLKTLFVFFIVFVVLTWIIPSGTYNGKYVESGLNPVGIFDLFKYPIYSLATFLQYGLVILSIGIFYGILSKTGAYNKLLDNIKDKIKKKKLFVGLITFILILLSSLIGSPLMLFVLVPFIYSLVTLLGYDKKSAFAVSVGSILVGNICTLCGNIIKINQEVLKISLSQDLFAKIILFLMVSLLYVNLVTNHLKEEKNEEIFYEKTKTNKSTLPVIVLSIFTFVILILGVFDLNKFGIDIFSKIHEAVVSFEVNGFYLFKHLFKGISYLGKWDNYDIMQFLLIMSLIISWVYGLKKEDIIEGLKDGIKKTYKAAIVATISGIIFVVLLNVESNIMETINNFILNTDFSIVKTSLATLSGSLFYNDYTWLMNSGFGNIISLYDSNRFVVLTILSCGIHSLLMLLLPTSVILTTGLTFTSLDYKQWLKYIWKFILIVFFVLLIISLILVKFV